MRTGNETCLIKFTTHIFLTANPVMIHSKDAQEKFNNVSVTG